MGTQRLKGETVPVHDLLEGEIETMFRIFSRHYERVSKARFGMDLEEKHFVILLRDVRTGEIRGFSTQKVLRTDVNGTPIRAIFSGDTIIDPAYWGEQELVNAWCRFAGGIHAQQPDARLFWFLICKGYRTYLYLPLFYRRYYPAQDHPTPPFEQEVLHALARMKYPGNYRPEKGLLEFETSQGNLTPELAQIPQGRAQDPRVRFFLSKNPRYAEGAELVCLAEISASNLRSIALRAFLEGAGRSSAGSQRLSAQASDLKVAV